MEQDFFFLRRTTKLQCMFTNVVFAQWKLESCSITKKVDFRQVYLYKNCYFIYKYTKMTYVLLVKPNRYINTQIPAKVFLIHEETNRN